MLRRVKYARPIADRRFRQLAPHAIFEIGKGWKQWRMRLQIADVQEEGAVTVAVFEEIHRVVGQPLGAVFVFWEWPVAYDPAVLTRTLGGVHHAHVLANGALVFGKSLGFERADGFKTDARFFFVEPYVHLSGSMGLVTGVLERLGQRCRISRQTHVSVIEKAVSAWTLAGHQRSPRWHTYRACGVCLSASYAPAGDGIEPRCLDDWMPLDAQAVSAKLIADDQDDVRLFGHFDFPSYSANTINFSNINFYSILQTIILKTSSPSNCEFCWWMMNTLYYISINAT